MKEASQTYIFLSSLYLWLKRWRVTNTPNTSKLSGYLVSRTRYLGRFFGSPQASLDLSIGDREHVSDLRAKLLRGVELHKPKLLTVRGTLFPCALLAEGWWERKGSKKLAAGLAIGWGDPVQEWLFNGFDLWAPSWDFTWIFDAEEQDESHPYLIAQLGSGDEADSMPVLIPQGKAERLREEFEKELGGLEVEVTGLLGHRKHFPGDRSDLEIFGGVLDYCLWLSDEDEKHKVSRCREKTSIYSGYLWKCLAPRARIAGQKDRINLLEPWDVFFVWEHTNFASPDAVAYGLDSLKHKEDYIEKRYGELVLIQKSSSLVSGSPELSARRAYERLFTGKVNLT